MRMRFLRDYKWAEQGMFVREYVKDQEEDVLEECAKAAVRDGAAKPVEAPKAEHAAKEQDTPGKPGEPEGSGQETPAASLPPAPASRQTKRNTSKAKPKSSQ
jgi:hypothetical protein